MTYIGLSETAIPGSNLEDFLWGNLWFIQWQGYISRYEYIFYAVTVTPMYM